MNGTYIGMSSPIIAKYDKSTDKYSDGLVCGEAVSGGNTPNYNEAKLYGDNKVVEDIIVYKDTSVTLGVTRLPNKAAEILFGHTVDEENGTITKSSNDLPNYVGVGYIVTGIKDGSYVYEANVLYCVKFSEPQINYATTGDSISFTTPSLSGTAIPKAGTSGDWEYDQEFETEAEALAAIKEILMPSS